MIHLKEQRLEFLDSMGGSDQGELLDPGELCTRMCFTGGGVAVALCIEVNLCGDLVTL